MGWVVLHYMYSCPLPIPLGSMCIFYQRLHFSYSQIHVWDIILHNHHLAFLPAIIQTPIPLKDPFWYKQSALDFSVFNLVKFGCYLQSSWWPRVLNLFLSIYSKNKLYFKRSLFQKTSADIAITKSNFIQHCIKRQNQTEKTPNPSVSWPIKSYSKYMYHSLSHNRMHFDPWALDCFGTSEARLHCEALGL